MYEYMADIMEVYDGDTVTADIDLGMRVWMRKEKIRFYGINAPEIAGPEHEAGLSSRDRLRQLILGKRVMIRTYKDKKDKYGRWLAEIFIKNETGEYTVCINDILLNEGLAVIT